MPERGTDQSSVDRHGIKPPSVFAIEPRDTVGEIAVLALFGELDLAAAPSLRERLDELRAAGTRGIVLDMAEVTFLDSSALRELLRTEAALRTDGVPLVLAAVQAPVERLLELTRTTGMLVTAPTLEAALERAAA